METLVRPAAGKPPSGRRMKARAPPPPNQPSAASRIHNEHKSSAETAVISDQSLVSMKENMINRSVDFTVILPNGVEQKTTVQGSKAVMDLLVDLCSRYHLNPSQHSLELKSLGTQQPLSYKANTLIGALDVQTVLLKEKVPEDTEGSGSSQSGGASPQHHSGKSLEELGISELYAWDRKRGELWLKVVAAGLDEVSTVLWATKECFGGLCPREQQPGQWHAQQSPAALGPAPGFANPLQGTCWLRAGRKEELCTSQSCSWYPCTSPGAQSLTCAVGQRGRKRRRAIVMAAAKAERQRQQSGACNNRLCMGAEVVPPNSKAADNLVKRS